jgi:hypothetical protein
VQRINGQIEHIPIAVAAKELLLPGDIPINASDHLILISACVGDGIEVVEGA